MVSIFALLQPTPATAFLGVALLALGFLLLERTDGRGFVFSCALCGTGACLVGWGLA